jgi:hypothetical protein
MVSKSELNEKNNLEITIINAVDGKIYENSTKNLLKDSLTFDFNSKDLFNPDSDSISVA